MYEKSLKVDAKGVIRNHKSKVRQYNDQLKDTRTKWQAMIHKTLHRPLKIVQHESTKKTEVELFWSSRKLVIYKTLHQNYRLSKTNPQKTVVRTLLIKQEVSIQIFQDSRFPCLQII